MGRSGLLRVGAVIYPTGMRIEQRACGHGAAQALRASLAAALAESIHLHRAGIEDALLARRCVGQWVDVAQSGLEQFSAELTFPTVTP